jgi:hypothetical protein
LSGLKPAGLYFESILIELLKTDSSFVFAFKRQKENYQKEIHVTNKNNIFTHEKIFNTLNKLLILFGNVICTKEMCV